MHQEKIDPSHWIDYLFWVWDSKRSNRIAPKRKDFDLPFDLLPIISHVGITKMVDGRIIHTLYGSGLVNIFRADYTQKPLDLYRSVGAGWAAEAIENVYKTMIPSRGIQSIFWQNRDYVKFYWSCLPLIGDDDQPNMTIGVIAPLPSDS